MISVDPDICINFTLKSDDGLMPNTESINNIWAWNHDRRGIYTTPDGDEMSVYFENHFTSVIFISDSAGWDDNRPDTERRYWVGMLGGPVESPSFMPNSFTGTTMLMDTLFDWKYEVIDFVFYPNVLQ